jgi:PPK2 family polyphosphate:nucleotide phosphotransferase
MSRTPPLGELLRIDPDAVELAGIDPRGTPGLPDDKAVRRDPKAWTRAALTDLGVTLEDLQTRLFASAKGAGDRRRVLLVLQAMDCGGKDGTIKSVAGAMNPLGMRIVGFGPPTEEELAHHFLWRIKQALPPAGYVGIFNRSHYEDVLIVRVHNLVPVRTWRGRYDQINRFEEGLVADGVTLVKVMLHISYEEQSQRLLDRLTDPTKYWKYNPADVDERVRWADYQAAYTDVLRRCSTAHAPWYVVPADRKWYRNWAVTNLLIETLSGLGLEYPPPSVDLVAERERLRRVA